MSPLARRAFAAGAGLLVDRVVGDPPSSVHPVAGFGTLMGHLERRVWADRPTRGVAYAFAGTALGLASGAVVRSGTVALGVSAAGRQLRTTARTIGAAVDAGDLAGARAALPALVGRDPSELDASGIAAAVIESVAENSVDAVIAPAFWTIVAGAPGALGYRAINTMDAMVGHRSERYGRFGTAAARLDDVANWIPARLFAGLVVAVVPSARHEIVAAVRRDAPAHPSPNAGVAEAAMAAAIGRELGGPLRYGERLERRPTLGVGPRPGTGDVEAAVRIADRCELAFVGACLVVAALARVAGGRR
jgi:adenosylcobinamide-phosphate synthase